MGAYESPGNSLQFVSFSGLDSDWGPRYGAVNVVTDPPARCCGLYICFGSTRISSVCMVLFISAPGRRSGDSTQRFCGQFNIEFQHW